MTSEFGVVHPGITRAVPAARRVVPLGITTAVGAAGRRPRAAEPMASSTPKPWLTPTSRRQRPVGRRTLDRGPQPRGLGLVRGGQPSSQRVARGVPAAREIDLTRLAVVLDVRTRGFFEQLPSMFTELGTIGTLPEILFLEAADDVIVRRQESVRRPHPLQGDGRLLDGIGRERETLATLRQPPTW